MPLYSFKCNSCNFKKEFRMTFETHENSKNSICCEKCNTVMTQEVSQLNFTLKGDGWFPKLAEQYDSDYAGLSQKEMTKNKDEVAKMDDIIGNMEYKESN